MLGDKSQRRSKCSHEGDVEISESRARFLDFRKAINCGGDECCVRSSSRVLQAESSIAQGEARLRPEPVRECVRVVLIEEKTMDFLFRVVESLGQVLNEMWVRGPEDMVDFLAVAISKKDQALLWVIQLDEAVCFSFKLFGFQS